MNSLHLEVLTDFIKNAFYKTKAFWIKHNINMWLIWYAFLMFVIPPAAIIYSLLLFGTTSWSIIVVFVLVLISSLVRNTICKQKVDVEK